MDANYTIDQKLGSGIIDLGILVLNEEHDHVLKIGEKTDIMLRLLLTIDCNPDLRYSLSLSEMEKEFIHCRRKRVMKKLCEFLGESAPIKEQEVPIVGVIGSGGGFRAMTAFSGVLKALTEEGILDCVTYIATLSGSAWYLSTLYSHPEFPKKSPGALQNELKSSICHNPFWLLSPRSLYRYITSIKAKYESGQPVSFTDFFGYLLGDTLLKGRIDCKLSDQKSKINDGSAPLPLYTCLHVKNNVSAKVFQDWLEFSPYEIGISKYAVFMKTHLFGSKLFKGKVVKVYPEYPLHYLQGVWGSAFCILFKRLIAGHTKLSIDVNPCSDSSGEDEDEIFYDAEEELHENEEDQLRSFLGNLDLDNDKTLGDNSDSEDDEGNTKESSTKGFKRMLTSGFWKDFVNNICTSSFVDTRKGRAGVILNPLRGLSLIPCFQFSPFSPTSPGDDIPFKGLTEPTPTQSKTMYLVDGGLTFNLPFPLLLRPQRAVDVYLAFDFSSRDSDSIPPFKELLISEKWAKINNCPFPPIHDLASEYVKQSPKECYVFKHPTDELCPVIVCFPLVNLDFKKYCKPGIRRETAEDLEFGDFSIFNDPKNCYSIYNFRYPHRQFERLSKLMEFNVLNNIGIIKEVFESVSERKKRHLSQASVVLADPPQKKI